MRIILIIFGLISNLYATPFEEFDKCQQEIEKYFTNPTNPKVKEFLELQSNITAHRLAWAYMILWQKTGEGLEGVIKDLEAKRDADPELKRIYEEFKANKRKDRFNDDYEKSKHTLIAASMKSMQLTLIKDYKVPKDSPFLLQTEDINLASLIDKVASNESRSNVLRQMTNLMDTVDNSYNMREESDKAALRTQWKKGQNPGYKGRNTEAGAKGQRGTTGTHHRSLSDRIIKDIEKIKINIQKLKQEVAESINSCKRDYENRIGKCSGDQSEILDQNILTLMQGDSGKIINLLSKKYQTSQNDGIQKALSQGGKVLENNVFNAKAFCNDPAKFICESKAEDREKATRDKFDAITSDAVNIGTQIYRDTNYICSSNGSNCNPSTSGTCSDCQAPSDCLEYKNMANRIDCYNKMNSYTIDKVFTTDIKSDLRKQTQNAKRDIIDMINSPPYSTKLDQNDRIKIVQVIRDAQIKIPTQNDYTLECMNDRRDEPYRCSIDSDCEGDRAYCGVPQVDYNMYATFKKDPTVNSNPTYAGSHRPCFIPEGMALSSSENMYGIILHELGHLISHDRIIKMISGFGTDASKKDPFKQEKQCFANDELSNHSNPRNKKVGESIADGIQAQAIGVKIKKLFPQTNPAQFNPKVIEFLSETVADNCKVLTNTRSEIDQKRQNRSTYVHPYGEDRINRIVFANKYISETLGCNLSGSQLPQDQQKYATPLNQCMNNP